MAALVLSVLGAAFITSRVNQPLKRLADTARAISAGDDPKALPEGGGTEVAQANHSFNQMVRDLKQLEADRAVMLAGISHDLRTPLTRLRLETEMSPVDEQTRELMVADIEQMDAIIGQFLNYARPAQESSEPVDLSSLVRDAVNVYAAHDDIRIRVHAPEPVMAMANRMEVQRILDNLVENARRYAKDPDSGVAEVERRRYPLPAGVFHAAPDGKRLCVTVKMQGNPTHERREVGVVLRLAKVTLCIWKKRVPWHLDKAAEGVRNRFSGCAESIRLTHAQSTTPRSSGAS
jgi:signal transduction histidine kinase